VEASGEYDEPIVTEILPADTFFKAEVRGNEEGKEGRREGGRKLGP